MQRSLRLVLAGLISVAMFPAAGNVAAQERSPTSILSAGQPDTVPGEKEPKKIAEPGRAESAAGRVLTSEQACLYSSTGIGVEYRTTFNADGTRTTRGAGVDGYPTVGELCDDSPAEQAGFAVGDVILQVDGADAREHPPFVGVRPRVTYVVRIRRDGTEREIELTPVAPRHQFPGRRGAARDSTGGG